MCVCVCVCVIIMRLREASYCVTIQIISCLHVQVRRGAGWCSHVFRVRYQWCYSFRGEGKSLHLQKHGGKWCCSFVQSSLIKFYLLSLPKAINLQLRIHRSTCIYSCAPVYTLYMYNCNWFLSSFNVHVHYSMYMYTCTVHAHVQ